MYLLVFKLVINDAVIVYYKNVDGITSTITEYYFIIREYYKTSHINSMRLNNIFSYLNYYIL